MKGSFTKFTLAVTCLTVITVPAFGQRWGDRYHASTAAEGFQRGMADVIRSSGERNLSNSAALINLEQARSMNFDNRLKYTETYFEMQRMNRAYRAEKRRPRNPNASNIPKKPNPSTVRMTSTEVDPVTGGVKWPLILQTEDFKADRERIDALFQERADAGADLTADGALEVDSIGDDMIITLKGKMKEFSPNDYINAKRFIERLSNEAKYPAA